MKYVKCDCCGKKIKYGEDVYYKYGETGKFCSPLCYLCGTDVQSCCDTLDDDIVEDKLWAVEEDD